MNSPLHCYSEVEWREVGERGTDESEWMRNQTCPIEGEVRWCQVHLYRQISAGQTCWLLFQTGNTLFNGWINTSEDLDALALVEVEILAAKAATGSPLGAGQWLQVRCLKIVPFAQIPQMLPTITLANWQVSLPARKPDCASEKLFLFEDGGEQVAITEFFSNDGSSSSPTHFIAVKFSPTDYHEICNWPLIENPASI